MERSYSMAGAQITEILFTTIYRISIVVIAAFVIVLAYWQWIDNPVPNKIKLQQIENSGKIYPSGMLRIRTVGCSLFPVVANSGIRTIRNDFVFRLSDQSTADGCFDTVRDYPVPGDAHLGLHTYQFCAEWRINPIKTVLHCNDPIPFDVTAAP